MNRWHTATLLIGLASSSGAAALTCANPRYDLERLAFQTAQRHNLPPALFVAMIGTESHFCTAAISPKGALGLGQIMPGTARDLGLTAPFDPASNLDASARYLRALFDVHHDWSLSLAAYNAGSANVSKYRGVPPFAETQNHVNLILLRANALNAQLPLINVLNATPGQLNASLQNTRPQLLGASQVTVASPAAAPAGPLQPAPVVALSAPTPTRAAALPITPPQAQAAAPGPTSSRPSPASVPSAAARPAQGSSASLNAAAGVVSPVSPAGLRTVRPTQPSTATPPPPAGLTIIRPVQPATLNAATTPAPAGPTPYDAAVTPTPAAPAEPAVSSAPTGSWSTAVIIHASGR